MGDGEAAGKPCAGCVGNADDKNPPGQFPDGPTDHNAGYECDRNEGIGQTNPAHTGCQAPEGEGEGEGSNPPACPAGTAAMTDYSYLLDGAESADDITGNVEPGDTVEVTFTIAAGCTDIEVSLASYDGDRALFHSHTGHFGTGEHTLSINTPDCDTEVDFVLGGVLPNLDNATGSPYRDQDRLLDVDRSSVSCEPAPGEGGSTGSENGGTGTEATGGEVVQQGSTQGNTPDAVVLGSAVSMTRGNGHAGGAEQARADNGVAPAPGAPAEVMGVQIERASAASLARTGVPAAPLAALGGLLCLVGVALTTVSRRRETVSVASRLAGYATAA
ncbi:MAG TPA: hypothetical protein VF230_05185 [Acidimicrobiales bacterium]